MKLTIQTDKGPKEVEAEEVAHGLFVHESSHGPNRWTVSHHSGFRVCGDFYSPAAARDCARILANGLDWTIDASEVGASAAHKDRAECLRRIVKYAVAL